MPPGSQSNGAGPNDRPYFNGSSNWTSPAQLPADRLGTVPSVNPYTRLADGSFGFAGLPLPERKAIVEKFHNNGGFNAVFLKSEHDSDGRAAITAHMAAPGTSIPSNCIRLLELVEKCVSRATRSHPKHTAYRMACVLL